MYAVPVAYQLFGLFFANFRKSSKESFEKFVFRRVQRYFQAVLKPFDGSFLAIFAKGY
jgi:hypothetical protein